LNSVCFTRSALERRGHLEAWFRGRLNSGAS
jgi:hypothetical protein